MTITIRHATEADIALLADIGRQTFYDAFHDNNSSQENFEKYVAEAFTLKQVTAEYQADISLYLLAENEAGNALAYVKVRWDSRRDELMTNTNYIEVERIYVQRNYWRMGIGKQMMDAVFDLARERGYESVCLSVYEENAAAILFYEGLGFEQVGTVEFRLGDVIEHDALMVKVVHKR